ncbi:MAG: hypothetical protein LBE89_04230 [Helicobacteraceae bacterium]|nr:hypothetical protein [Helicobacteraceae bacterium]
MRTLSYIARQILYFNPLKIFTLFSCAWIAFGALCFTFTAFTGMKIGYNIGIFSIFGAFLMFGLGLLAEQIRQLMASDWTQK